MNIILAHEDGRTGIGFQMGERKTVFYPSEFTKILAAAWLHTAKDNIKPKRALAGLCFIPIAFCCLGCIGGVVTLAKFVGSIVQAGPGR